MFEHSDGGSEHAEVGNNSERESVSPLLCANMRTSREVQLDALKKHIGRLAQYDPLDLIAALEGDADATMVEDEQQDKSEYSEDDDDDEDYEPEDNQDN